MTSSEALKKIRSELGLTQNEFAAKIKITKELLSQIERGVRELSYSTAFEINEYFKQNPIPNFLRIQFEVGQNLEKVLNELFSRGIGISQFKKMGFNFRKAHLAAMYIGIIPVPLELKNVLVKNFKVRLKFINEGALPMFSDESKSSIEENQGKKEKKNFFVELSAHGDKKEGKPFEEALMQELDMALKTSPDNPGFLLLDSKLKKLDSASLKLEALAAFFEMNVSIDCILGERLKLSDKVSTDCFISFNEIGKAIIELINHGDFVFVLSQRYWVSPYLLRLEFEVSNIKSKIVEVTGVQKNK